MDHISDLNDVFDEISTRQKPLKEREPITFLLDQLLEEIIHFARPDFVLEVGAFEAAFSKKMKISYPDIPVVALEANPRVFEHFATTLSDTGVNYRHVAAASHTGNIDIHIPKVIAGKDMPKIGRMGSLLEVGLRDSVTEKVEVPCDTLDNVASGFDFKNACIWIDVEGFADQVLRGAGSTLEQTTIIYVELESSPVWEGQVLAKDIIETLEGLGLIMVARDCQKWFQFNALFIRPDLFEDVSIRSKIENFKQEAISLFLA